MEKSLHIAIIGAGITGLSTANALLSNVKRRQRVTVLEQSTVDHERGTSHGFSRLLRFEYGSDLFYTNMVRLSLIRWRQLERATGRELYTRSGVVTLGMKHDRCTVPSYRLMRSLGLPVEQLQADKFHRRFPQFATSAFDTFIYNAEGGILHASSCLQALRDRVRDLGGEIRENSRIICLEHDRMNRPVQLRLASGEVLEADRVIVAAGPWVHHLLADMRLPMRVTRQYLLYFAGLSPSLFAAGRFPAFLADTLYGFPIHRGCNGWVKVASHDPGATISPNDTTPPDQTVLTRIRHQLYELLPQLRAAQVARVDACMYDMSPDGDFILDRLFDDPRVVVATGLSGHGFKFGLLLGEVLSSMVCETEPVIPIERFGLNRFAVTPQWVQSATFSAPLSGVSR